MVVRYCVNMPSFEIKRSTLIFGVVKYTTVFVLFIRQKLKAPKVKIESIQPISFFKAQRM